MSEVTNGQIMQAILGLTEKVGGLTTAVQNNSDHTSAVSGKCDKIRLELQEHSLDENAHGMGGERRANKGWSTWLPIAISAATLGVVLLKMAKAGQ